MSGYDCAMARHGSRLPSRCFAVHAGLMALLVGLFLFPANGWSQNTGRTIRRHKVMDNSASAIAKAEAAIERKQYAQAEKDLKSLISTEPDNYRAWFDLGVIYGENGRTSEAIEAYRKSVKANPQIFESTLNLGILLARAGDPDAETYLRSATQLKPPSQPEESHARAWVALGHVLQPKQPKKAIQAFQQAAALQPRNPAPHILAARAAAQMRDWPVAENEYAEAARLDPEASEIETGQLDVYLQSRQFAKAEAALRAFLQYSPQASAGSIDLTVRQQAARIQLGRVLAAQGKNEEAQIVLEAGLKDSEDGNARRELAQLYLQAKNYEKAAEQLRILLQSSPNDADVHAQLGGALLQQRQFAEAQKELLSAVKLNPRLPQAYSDLALAASENKEYELCLQALDARAKLLPEAPGTYFLRAVAYDHLRDRMHAVENYEKFLEVANGQFPDQEWQARHRLIAINPKKQP